MASLKIVLAVLLFMGAVPVIAAPTSGVLPNQTVPNGTQAVEGAAGGRILHGSLAGVASGSAAFKAGLHRTNEYFAASLKPLGAVRSKDGNVTLCAFSATLRGVPVSGLVVAAYAANGGSRFAALFDVPQRLRQSLRPMLEQLKDITQETLDRTKPAGGGPATAFARYEAASRNVALRRMSYPDGTASIGVAAGFTPQVMQSGQFLAGAADGAYIKLYMPVSLLDPSGSIYQMEMNMARNNGGGLPPGQVFIPYNTDPASVWPQFLAENARQNNAQNPDPQVLRSQKMQNVEGGWIGKLVSGTITIQGKPFVFTGSLLVSPPPSAEGAWLLQITILAAPEERAATDMPALIAMQRSEKVDMQALRNQTMRNIAIINAQCASWLAANKAAGDAARDAVFQRSMADARSSEDTMDRTAAGFIDYISDTSVVQNNQTGVSSRVNSGLASSMVNSNPTLYSQVPVSQYRSGVNY